MIVRRLLSISLWMGLSLSSLGHAQTTPLWRSVDFARQLRDTMPQRVRVQYGAGRVDVRGADGQQLYGMHLRYDESRSVPLHRYDAEQRSAVLGLESRGNAMRNASGTRESGELRLTLPRAVPLDLDLALGGTQSTLDLGAMSLRSLTLKCNATDANLLFSNPNRGRMRDIDISVGAAGLTASHLANANAEQMRVQAGVGGVDLDFSGTWTHDLAVTAQVGLGKLTLRVPPDVGLRLDVERLFAGFDHAALVKRGDGWYSANYDAAPYKLHIRAQTYFGQIEIQQTR